MPRKLRLQYEGAIYHLMNRGDRREDIFIDDKDRQRFLETLGEACEKTDWQVHAYCLMRNHFHLVAETPRPNLVSGMQWFLGTYTTRFNRRHRFAGHLFSGRYKAQLVEGSGNGYLKTVCDYVHLNPVRARLLAQEQTLLAYPWSSYPAYVKAPTQRVSWLRVDRLFGEWGIQRDNEQGRQQFHICMEQRRQQELSKQSGDWEQLRRGWCWGSQDFQERMLECVGDAKGMHHHGKELAESDEQKARRLLERLLAEAGLQQSRLEQLGKGQKQKARIAARLRAETTMTWGWIADQLAMGYWRTAANAVRSLPRSIE